jgi:hypothetical protein
LQTQWRNNGVLREKRLAMSVKLFLNLRPLVDNAMTTKIHAIRKEFGEPFRDVVRGFAQMGYSQRATAEILEFNRSYFRQLCARFDLLRHFKKQRDMRDECKPYGGAGPGWTKGKKRVPHHKFSIEFMLGEARKHPRKNDCIAGGLCHPDTIIKRLCKPWKEIVRQANELAKYESVPLK